MAARASRDPAPKGRVFKALRKMAQGQRVRPQLRLERRTKDAGLDPGGARGAVDLEHSVQVPQIEGDRRLDKRAALEPRLDAADHAAAAAERDQHRLGATRPIDRPRLTSASLRG